VNAPHCDDEANFMNAPCTALASCVRLNPQHNTRAASLRKNAELSPVVHVPVRQKARHVILYK
jgi:hypothetical protein